MLKLGKRAWGHFVTRIEIRVHLIRVDPKLYGPFSGVTILFGSQERRRFKSSNLKVIFLFVTLKTC